MSDIVTRLRDNATILEVPPGGFPTVAAECREAADEIERLRETLLYRVNQDNACRDKHGGWLVNMRPVENCPCGLNGRWDSKAPCGCVLEASEALRIANA